MEITVDGAFEERKNAVFQEAQKQGIVDVVFGASDSINLETIELAARLTEKHGPELFKRLEERRNSQK